MHSSHLVCAVLLVRFLLVPEPVQVPESEPVHQGAAFAPAVITSSTAAGVTIRDVLSNIQAGVW